jgi:Asp-tRNA(Asn)/Glu-tRNA(Gln) amidotransferase A subunit family amidase
LVVTPGFGSQSQLHGFGKFCFVSAAYTFIWNVLEMAVGALPVTVVRENEQTYDTVHNDFVSTRLIGNASKSAGLPVGVQIVGLPYQEEKILGLMKAIDERIGFSKKHRLPL